MSELSEGCWCERCDNEKCPSPRIKKNYPERGCNAWTSQKIRDFIKTLPVIVISRSVKTCVTRGTTGHAAMAQARIMQDKIDKICRN